jgi:hypothetical protein
MALLLPAAGLPMIMYQGSSYSAAAPRVRPSLEVLIVVIASSMLLRSTATSLWPFSAPSPPAARLSVRRAARGAGRLAQAPVTTPQGEQHQRPDHGPDGAELEGVRAEEQDADAGGDADHDKHAAVGEELPETGHGGSVVKLGESPTMLAYSGKFDFPQPRDAATQASVYLRITPRRRSSVWPRSIIFQRPPQVRPS